MATSEDALINPMTLIIAPFIATGSSAGGAGLGLAVLAAGLVCGGLAIVAIAAAGACCWGPRTHR
jgi:hypothetical protein